MDLVSIGEFSRLSRLSPRALRLYDELGVAGASAVAGVRDTVPGRQTVIS